MSDDKGALRDIAFQFHGILENDMTQLEQNVARILVADGYGKWKNETDGKTFRKIMPGT